MSVSALTDFFDSYRVAAYITAYQDAEALSNCLSAIRSQSYAVKQVLVIDNSPLPLPLSVDHAVDDRVLIQSHPENIGIAGGLNLAIEWAIQQEYDFLWMFDQDSTPDSDCLESLIQAYHQLAADEHKIGIVAPTSIDARTGEIVKSSMFLGDRFRGYDPPDTMSPYECDAPITSGSLVWIGAAQQILPPDRGLFIDGIDLDYGFRLRQAGFHNLIVPKAKMQHHFGVPFAVKLLNRQKVFQLYSPLRYYYICRNHTYLELQHSYGWYQFTCVVRRLKYLLLTCLKILVFDSGSKIEKLYACTLGTWDGFLGKLGKNWQ